MTEAQRKRVKATGLKPGMQLVRPNGDVREVESVTPTPASRQTTTQMGGKTWRSGLNIPSMTVRVTFTDHGPPVALFKTQQVEVLDG